MPIPNVDEKTFKAAMDILMMAIKADGEFVKNLRKTFLKVHPDKGGDPEVFKATQPIYELFNNFTKNPQENTPDLLMTMLQIPEAVRIPLSEKFSKSNDSFKQLVDENPIMSTYKSVAQYDGFTHDSGAGRSHGKHEVMADKFKNLKDQFKDLKGDHLKTKILEDLQSKILDVSTTDELAQLKEEIKGSDEYKVLNTGQGWATKTFGLKTSSASSLDDMFKEQEENISNPGLGNN